ncbi:hypothetical protein F4777DRAFT_573807 [Nemania sp. FL0916]|nr:hypothetical protein F4777DRAFT_573807 [Nemania sp. FL0916]
MDGLDPTIDPKIVAEMREKYPGLDEKLYYLPGHAIHDHYESYKAANEAARQARANYHDTAEPLRTNNQPGKGVGKAIFQRKFTKDGHRTLEPLAGAAATASGEHHDRRDEFNKTYEDLLKAKGVHEGHEKQAREAKLTQVKWTKVQAQHARYGRY